MLTRIRNAGSAQIARVSMPESRLKREIARVLHERGFIQGFSSDHGETKPKLTVELRYDRLANNMIQRIERVSRPGRRVYVRAAEVPTVRNGLGVAILSTPRGVLTDEQAREANVGGEILARVW
ncbi:MAG: 30S ribosomal protein S8 [Myxococcales bacterium]|nr:30S ribosomal protein S8 [Myxococcales bacterium]